MELTESPKRFFYEEGYPKVLGAVPRVMVDAARQAINAENRQMKLDSMPSPIYGASGMACAGLSAQYKPNHRKEIHYETPTSN